LHERDLSSRLFGLVLVARRFRVFFLPPTTLRHAGADLGKELPFVTQKADRPAPHKDQILRRPFLGCSAPPFLRLVRDAVSACLSPP